MAENLEQLRILLPYTPLCSVPFVPQAKFTRPQLTGPAFAKSSDCRGSPGKGLGSGIRPEASDRNPGEIGVDTIWVQSVCNPPELHQVCQNSRIQSQSCGLQIWRSRLRGDCDHQKSSFRGLRGTERIAEDPRAAVWVCPPVWAQT